MSPKNNDEGGGFLSGWSRRKLAARRQETEARDSAEETDTAAIDAEVVPETGDAIEPAQQDNNDADADLIADLPAIDDITERTDLAPFMRRGVPLALRNAALRKVWMLNPLIRDHVDPALDYAWDWNAPGGVPGGGGVLTDEGVSKMVKNLLGDAQPAQDAASSKPTEDSPDNNVAASRMTSANTPLDAQRQQPDSDDGTDPSETTVPDQNPSVASASATNAQPVANHSDISQPTKLRRHGGATPD
ncbi:MAG: DUF3306 domain-containing protein [Pseudomonadota bacterium]